MMKIRTLMVTVACLLLATCGCAQSWKGGEAAPSFSAKGSDGKTYSLDSIKKKSGFVLYFIKIGCPTNDQAVKFYNQIAKAYQGKKVQFFGVINGDKAAYDEWQKQYKTPFVTLIDPELKIKEAFRVERSPWAFFVGADGKVAKEWVGYSTKDLNEMNKLMAKAAKTKEAKLNLAGCPSNTRFG